MKALPTIGQVMELARCSEASSTKQAAASEPQFLSEIAKGLHEVASIVKSAEETVTYDDVLGFGRGLLGRQP